jgi:hypothetical protein
MKKLIFILSFFMVGFNVYPQIPYAFNYQAVIRDNLGNILPNQSVSIQLSLLAGAPDGTVIFRENHSKSTDQFGLVDLIVGRGTTILGSLDEINWNENTFYLQVAVDIAGGINFIVIGTSQLLSVPYALYARTADSITVSWSENDPVFNASVASGITANDTSLWNNKLDFEIDGSYTNEIQTISRTGQLVTLSNGGGSFIDSVNEYKAGAGIEIIGDTIKTLPTGHYVGELFGGGIVCYVYNNGKNGLIASLDDLNGGSGVAWSQIIDVEIGTDAQNALDGALNTAAMLDQDASLGFAGSLCSNYNGGGFSD